MTRIVLTTGLVILLSACAPLLSVFDLFDTSSLLGHSLEVNNYCGGPNTTVDVYVDGRTVGSVYYSRTFYGIQPGSRQLTARGTGAGGGSFSRAAVFNGDLVWTLCP